MAPLAYLAIYKACYQEQGGDPGASCFFSDTAAAADTAVADGVDIMSFSIGTAAAFDDPVDIAFLNAADAGVFVAQSAGNEGPAPFTTGGRRAVGHDRRGLDAERHGLRAGDARQCAGVDCGGLRVIRGGVHAAAVGNRAADAQRRRGRSDRRLHAAGRTRSTARSALVARGDCNFDVKVANASLAGAKGVIVYSQVGNPKVPMARRSDGATRRSRRSSSTTSRARP